MTEFDEQLWEVLSEDPFGKIFICGVLKKQMYFAQQHVFPLV